MAMLNLYNVQFVMVHQQLLNIVIENAGLLQNIVGDTAVAVFQNLEGIIDICPDSLFYSCFSCKGGCHSKMDFAYYLVEMFSTQSQAAAAN